MKNEWLTRYLLLRPKSENVSTATFLTSRASTIGTSKARTSSAHCRPWRVKTLQTQFLRSELSRLLFKHSGNKWGTGIMQLFGFPTWSTSSFSTLGPFGSWTYRLQRRPKSWLGWSSTWACILSSSSSIKCERLQSTSIGLRKAKWGSSWRFARLIWSWLTQSPSFYTMTKRNLETPFWLFR